MGEIHTQSVSRCFGCRWVMPRHIPRPVKNTDNFLIASAGHKTSSTTYSEIRCGRYATMKFWNDHVFSFKLEHPSQFSTRVTVCKMHAIFNATLKFFQAILVGGMDHYWPRYWGRFWGSGRKNFQAIYWGRVKKIPGAFGARAKKSPAPSAPRVLGVQTLPPLPYRH